MVRRLEGRNIGKSISLYRFLGEGAAAEVYEAVITGPVSSLRQGQHVAIKIYKPAILEYPNQKQRIEREFKLGTVLKHPNLVEIYDLRFTYINNERRPYIIMELLEGITLRAYVEKYSPLSEEQIITSFRQLCDVTNYLHDAGLVHRDIKPENIMIENNRLVLMDLGVIKDPKVQTITASDQFLGTIRYASPEYLFKLAATDKSDTYSVGATLYYMVFGYDIYHEEKLFSNLVSLIFSKEPTIDIPARASTKRLCLLLEIARRLLLKNPQKRMNLQLASPEIILCLNSDLWKSYVIPLIEYRAASIWQWGGEQFPEEPRRSIYTALSFLPKEFYNTVVNKLPDEDWITVYIGKNIKEKIGRISNLNEILSVDAVDMELNDWKHCFSINTALEARIALLRSILCMNVVQNLTDELIKVVEWAESQSNNREVTEFCRDCVGYLYHIEDLLYRG